MLRTRYGAKTLKLNESRPEMRHHPPALEKQPSPSHRQWEVLSLMVSLFQ